MPYPSAYGALPLDSAKRRALGTHPIVWDCKGSAFAGGPGGKAPSLRPTRLTLPCPALMFRREIKFLHEA
jgi:hypothetical protein